MSASSISRRNLHCFSAGLHIYILSSVPYIKDRVWKSGKTSGIARW